MMIGLPVWFFSSKPARDISNFDAARTEGSAASKAIDKSDVPPPPGTAAISPVESTGGQRIVFLGLGDMLFDRQVAKIIKDKGIAEIFSDVGDLLRSGDVVVGNLECPLSSRGAPVKNKEYTFRGLPEAAAGMRDAGITMVSLANNHMMDYGVDAFVDTTDLLDKVGISYAGAGMNRDEAYRHASIDVNGKRVAFFAYSSILPEGFWATSKKAGIAGARMKPSELQQAIEGVAGEHDFTVVSFHWGIEYEDYPQEYQREFARRAIDAGADIVIGHHPHVIQGIEIYRGKLIAYSLGDFVFDHYSRKTGETFVLKVELDDGELARVDIIPVYADFSGRPAIVEGKEAQAILSRLKTISEPLKTEINITGDTAEVVLAQ